MNSYVETVARELLSDGWRPTSDQCFVAVDGSPASVVDYLVWEAMRKILETEKPTSGPPRSHR